ncbi:Fe-Mn family superoxide dismutase [Intestinibacter bartlettii]|uniref:Fe-Mn family superoxide dismutase n=1 Tax=Intestinibacter bartlettii TaxID=261299 RepID=UPI001D12F39C|nr:Fe-Mn family superoxide dismutase [Intestinibacter bartlettii]MCC2705839.1 Fe-Mn family superoxide dismutase [Intestinibacter bartlettii]MCC2761289.1 Fe-Mn family superoxide dismutase [Intestinibacter bartlettii]MDU6472251.1 Fe-Mn family superoxide dismutase [Intestinibacter bartlettii]
MKNLILFLLILSINICPSYSYALNFSELKPIKLNYNFYDLNDFINSNELKYSYCQYGAYLDNLNHILKNYKEFKDASLKDLLTNLDSMPDEIALKVKINASNALNYEYFFNNLSSEKTFAKGKILKEINNSFSSFDNFKKEFEKIALNSNSDWIFLALNSQNKLYLTTSKEVSSPVIYKDKIILCLNLDKEIYSNREQIIHNFLNYVDWNIANKNYNSK